jgi:hypothetical protein
MTMLAEMRKEQQQARREQQESAQRLEHRLQEQNAATATLERTLQAQHQQLQQQQVADRAEAMSRFEALEGRIAKLEKPPVPPVPVFPPAWQPAGGSSTAATSEQHSRASSARPATRASDLDDRFIPDVGFLRGWSAFTKNFNDRKDGISREVARDLVERIRTSTRDSVDWSLVCRVSHGSFRNFQVSLFFKDACSENAIYGFARDLNAALKSKGITQNSKAVYFALDQPLWKKLRNAKLRKYKDIFDSIAPGLNIEIDWSAGRLWQEREGSDALLVYSSEKRSEEGRFAEGIFERLHISRDVFNSAAEKYDS